MSLCNTKKLEEDDDVKTTTNVQLPINDLSLLKPSNLKENTPGKTKKNKSRTPKVVKFKIDQDKDSNQFQKKDSASVLHFFEITDDNRIEKTEDDKTNEDKSLDSSISGLKYESEQEKQKENEEKNNDSNKKPEVKWDLYTDKLISNTINKLDDENKSDEDDKNEILDKDNNDKTVNKNENEEKYEKEDKDDNKEKKIKEDMINKNEEKEEKEEKKDEYNKNNNKNNN